VRHELFVMTPTLEEFRKRVTIIPVVVGRGKTGEAKHGKPRLLVSDDLGMDHLYRLREWCARRIPDSEKLHGITYTTEERKDFNSTSVSNLLGDYFEADLSYTSHANVDEVLILYKRHSIAATQDLAKLVWQVEYGAEQNNMKEIEHAA